MGSGQNVRYLDEKSIAWFDNLDRRHFDMDTIDCMIRQFGYQNQQLIFWCPPGKALDELIEIFFEKHCQMMSKASVESKVLV